MIASDPRIHPPKFIRHWFPDALWVLEDDPQKVYLTFDDGPIPEATHEVLDILSAEDVKATFFCVGENVSKHPTVYQRLITEGHSTGNHTHNHLQGLKTRNSTFFENIDKAAEFIDSRLFRPPHGLLKPSQYLYLRKHYQIVMWDILTLDYLPSGKAPDMLNIVAKYVRPGSIITFHDSVKSISRLKQTLPLVIKMLKDKGFELAAIPCK